ncbi:hypothetical protein HYU17_03295 [Candidatus Woesearchaeota archaeon]|nr:hypothetical protein [Candidatus Woesearchaeota archaeon]
MASVLYVGEDLGFYSASLVIAGFKLANPQKGRWDISDVPTGIEFLRGLPDSFGHWLRGEIPEWQPQSSYAAVVVEYPWQAHVPVIKQVHPTTPIILSC